MHHVFILSEVADLSAGHPFRTSLALESAGPVRVVSMAHSIGDALVLDSVLPQIDFTGDVSRLQLEAGDLLFRPRGVSTQAIYVESVAQPCIFAAPLVRIRIKNPKQTHGWYLHWLLNSPAVQRDINAQARGSMIRMVSMESLRNLQIPMPPMRVQHEIAEVARLLREERALSEALMKKNKAYAEQVLWAKAQEVTTT
ncbi:restriction endonuclease subunit S [Polaromonas sp. SM01]|uniref:restriction endonuclease subunit S n=1 Tax=Polaromonas sp. SM01 TaxID=3085630 RepID=UPI0029827497|nr:restriction endonuclease subunit S [Polaromonas sp. SM01]MDW5441321.1 restriction endonuclease subunit S [Polaromonas sp. SM01]